jgi:hypothetical protein
MSLLINLIDFSSRVLWWSVIQTLVLVVAGAWQMRHLKGFFEAKKLV